MLPRPETTRFSRLFSAMSDNRPMTAEEIFMAAAEHNPGSDRDGFLSRMCAGNPAIRTEVESLLVAHDSAGSFLIQPFVNLSGTDHRPNPTYDSEDRSGSRLGRYQLNARIGSGGMGEVYRAHDTQLEREVAIKLLAPIHTSNAAWLRRFHREAKAAGAVNHPNILTIYEIGSVADLHFIATEFIEGMTLRTLLAGGSLKLSQVLEMATQIASALVAAHAASIVHRDLKPENIMVRGDGLIKVLDFGLAKHLDPTDAQPRLPGQTFISALVHRNSAPGSVMGTIHYMSPEQARGLPVDTRSDLFSFGIVLFEMLTGHQPFSGATSSDVLVAILEREPPRPVNSGYRLPDELERIVSKALRKDRDHRYQAAKDLHADLKRMIDDSERPTVARFATLRTGKDDRQKDFAHEVRARQVHEISPDAGTPEVRYTCSGDVNIAYQVFGEGMIDLVFVMGWVSHLEWFWKQPAFARFLRRLGKFARIILFDKRGTGLSDRVPVHELPTLEQRMDDVRAVMDAVDSPRAVLCGISEGGPMCTLFAATYPEKTIALTMIGSYARRMWAPDYPWGVREEDRTHFFEEIRRNWGGPVGIEDRAPSVAFDPEFRDWWATYLRAGASPGAALALTQMNARIDIRPILPMIQVPTLVIHRSADRCLKVEEGRYLAQHIPGAKFVELPGEDHLPFVGDQDAILDEIEMFLTGVRHAPSVNRVLATVLAARPVRTSAGESRKFDSHERFERYQSHVLREVELFRGGTVAFTDNSFLAPFDGPTRAIRAALAINDSARRLGLSLQAGLHIGECDVHGHSIRGAAVDFARRISQIADMDEVLVSSTIKDLVAGSGIQFAERSAETLPEGTKLFRVQR